MKKLLHFFLLLIAFNVESQTTHQINWTFGANAGAADLTIETGDTVEWVWGDPANHTVTSLGGSTETFNSGTLNGTGTKYSKTFNVIGSNNYQCNFHPTSMNGIITVEAPLSINDFAEQGFSVFPNPAQSKIVFKIPNNLNEVKVEIFDILGKEIYSNNKFSKSSINVSNWSKGVYVVKVSSDNITKAKQLLKL